MSLSSDNVHVFPYGSSRINDPNARVLNEQNITQLVKNLTDKSSYVLSTEKRDNGSINFQFVIEGYYFDVDIPQTDFDSITLQGSSLWAYIKLANTNKYSYLLGGDVDFNDNLRGSGTDGDPYIFEDGTTCLNLTSLTPVYCEYNFTSIDKKITFSHNVKINANTATEKISNTIKVPEPGEYAFTLASPLEDSIQVTVDVNKRSTDLKFTGIDFAASLTDSQKTYCLELLKKNDDGTWTVPESSLLKYDASKVEYTDRITVKSKIEELIEEVDSLSVEQPVDKTPHKFTYLTSLTRDSGEPFEATYKTFQSGDNILISCDNLGNTVISNIADLERITVDTGEIVSSVEQFHGKVSVNKRKLTSRDIPNLGNITSEGKIGDEPNKAIFTDVDTPGLLKAGILPVEAGGTGASSIAALATGSTLGVRGTPAKDNIEAVSGTGIYAGMWSAEEIKAHIETITGGESAGEVKASLEEHVGDKLNPHHVTKEQVGLGNVPNVATNDQTPTFTQASTLATLVSGEKLSISFGKIMKAITDFISHISNKSNPHGVTKSQVGLGNVADLSLAGIQGALTGSIGVDEDKDKFVTCKDVFDLDSRVLKIEDAAKDNNTATEASFSKLRELLDLVEIT